MHVKSITSKPAVALILSVCLAAMAITQLAVLSVFLISSFSAAAATRLVYTPTAVDWILLFGISAILLISAVRFYQMRKQSIAWFAVYSGLGCWAALWFSMTPSAEPFFDELASLAGLIAAVGILGYQLKLKSKGLLI